VRCLILTDVEYPTILAAELVEAQYPGSAVAQERSDGGASAVGRSE
jgi:hypothetical protein